MEIWKRNLLVCWCGSFLIASGNNQVAPVLPLYIEQLGVQSQAEIAQWAGIAFGVNQISLAIFSPIWGKAADKYGRKPMLLRASLWLAIIAIGIGFVQNVYQLVGLRLLQGALSGFVSAAITLVATQTPKKRVGWALGTLSTGQIGGTLLGPLIGGFLAETLGLRSVFYFISIFALIAFVGSFLFVREELSETNTNTDRSNVSEGWNRIPNHGLMICIFVTTFMVQLGLMSIQPILTVYIAKLSQGSVHIALISGAVFAASGFASILSGPQLGKLSDKIGPHKVMVVLLLVSGILFIPQAFVQTSWQLGVLRFCMGVVTAGLLPSINTLIKKSTPDAVLGRAFGYNQFAQHLGGFGGAILGGQVAACFGIPYVFFFTGALLAVNALWAYKKVYQKVEA